MAERRMFAKTIVLSDAFLDMPMSARNLYFTLGMVADDDGFVNAPRGVMRQIGASDDDMDLLDEKKFVLIFESGVIVIKHWRINNYLQKDRYNETKYLDEKSELTVDKKGAYHRQVPDEKPMYTGTEYTDTVYTQDADTQVRLDKDSIEIEEESIDKDNKKENNVCIDRAREETAYPDIVEDGVKNLEQLKVKMDIYVKMMREDLRKGRSIDPILRLAKAKGMDADELERRARA